jgi:hypothetical protein
MLLFAIVVDKEQRLDFVEKDVVDFIIPIL